MGNIITGAEISTYKTRAITVSVAKKENRNGVKARFIVLTAKDKGSMISKASRIPIFEDELGAEVFEILKKYMLLGADGKPVKDQSRRDSNGTVIDLKASDDAEDLEGLLTLEGGMVMQYDLGGAYYANDINGEIVKDGRDQPVIKTSIPVFVQVKNMVPTENGGVAYNFYAGMGLEERGSRIKAQFYRTPVAKVVAPAEAAGEKADDQPF
jgi:hypothetical protein